jgi:tripartite-type tricarboxylate transporter receptor subunit TctC
MPDAQTRRPPHVIGCGVRRARLLAHSSIVFACRSIGIGVVACAAALAQTYPTQAIRLVVPFPPGGGVDTMGRIVAQKMSESFGRQVVVDNRGGANGAIGSELVAKAPRDGYTLLMNGVNLVTSPSLFGKVGYDPISDFDPISMLASAPNVLVAHPSLQATTVRQLIATARAHPGQVTFAGSGSGSTPHLAGELFKYMTKTDMIHVPYRGTGPAITGVLSGEAGIMFMPALPALPLVKSGRMKALAVTSEQRLPALPSLPTVAESGLKGYESSQWYGVLAPVGTPSEILNVLNSTLVRILHQPEMKTRLNESGTLAIGDSREDFARRIKSELDKWTRIIKLSGATAQ